MKLASIVTLSIISGIYGCSDSKVLNSSTDKGESNLIASEDAEQDTITVAEPISVGGAFLYCAQDAQVASRESQSGIGCAMQQAGLKLDLPLERIKTDLSVSSGDKKITVSDFKVADSKSRWHWVFSISKEHADSATIDLSMIDSESEWNQSYESAVIDEATVAAPELSFSFDGITLQEVNDGLTDGHFDVDTSIAIFNDGDGRTEAHIHAFDDRYNVNGVDVLDLADERLLDFEDTLPEGAPFKLIVVNEGLSPGAAVTLNGKAIRVKDFNRYVSNKVFRIDGDDDENSTHIEISELKVAFEIDAISNSRIVVSETKCVQNNEFGVNGEYRNGALLLQAISVGGAINPNTGAAASGLLWEMSIFNHGNSSCSF